MTLTEFLLARIAEDETAAGRDDGSPMWDPDRVLAECEAKRRIVEECIQLADDDPYEIESAAVTRSAAILQFIALPYANHPDYREEWKP